MKNGVVFACNDFFFEGLVVGINSLKLYNPEVQIEVLDTGLTNEQVRYLSSDVGGVKIINIQKELQTNFTNKRDWHLDFSVYGSLFVDKSSFDNIIFCDTDLLILGNIDNVFKMIEKYDIVATKANSINSYFNPKNQVLLKRYVTVKGQTSIESMLNVDINWDYVTFNSGFWGIKKDYFLPLKSKYWDLLKRFESEFIFHDQTFMNLVCCLENKCYYDLGFCYNAVNVGSTNIYTGFKSFVKYIIYKIKQSDYKIQKVNRKVSFRGNNVYVLHFTGRNKPFFPKKLYGDAILLWNTFKMKK